MAEKACRFLRVSTDKQDALNELADVDRHIDAHGYAVAETYELNVSASSGEHEPALDQILSDIRAGRYTVVVLAHSSRIDRRDEDKQEAFAMAVRMAGGRIESAREPMFGKRDIGGRVVTMLAQWQNAEYSRTLKGHIGAGMRAIAANGAFCGSCPWGAVSLGSKKSKRLIPTNSARVYGPQILERAARGESLGDIARWLTSEGVPSGRGEGKKGAPWHAKTVGQVIRSKTLIGRYQCTYTVTDQATGERETLSWWHGFEAVADYALWKAANDKLSQRSEVWRQDSGRKASEPLSGAAKCHACGGASPMYRLGGSLRCSGTGADRKGCGAPMVPLDVAHRLSERLFAGMTDMHYTVTRRVPGNAAEIEIKRAELELREKEIAGSSMTRQERRAATAELDRQFDALDATEIIPDTEVTEESEETVADRWSQGTVQQKRTLVKWAGIEFGIDDGTSDFSEVITVRRGANQVSPGREESLKFGMWVTGDHVRTIAALWSSGLIAPAYGL